MQSEPHDADWLTTGSGRDRDFIDLGLALNDAVLWRYSFADDEVHWVSAGAGTVLGVPGATPERCRSRLYELAAPLISSARTSSTRDDWELEQTFTDVHGRSRALRFRARRFNTANETELLGIAGDTTQAYQDQEALADLAERYRLLAQLMPVAVCVHQDDVIIYANEAMAHLVAGRSSVDVIGNSVSELVAQSDASELWQRLAALTVPGATAEPAEVTINRVDGGTVLVEAVAVRITWLGRPAYQVLLRDITSQRASEAQLRHQATHDELTGLLNRKGINELIAELTRAERVPMAVLFCDIDNFKRINDSLGHEAGDELLATLGRHLQREVPDECRIARLSADEFLIICPDVEPGSQLERLMRRVSETLRTTIPVRGQLINVSASIGAAIFEGGMSSQDLLRYADMAMFHAKARGPGSVSTASPALVSAGEAQLRLEGELREAIRRDTLVLQYQPIVARDGQTVEAEALLRWPHPEQGMLAPDVILHVAEQADLLRELDMWVLRTALAEAVSWPLVGRRRPSVAVNLAELLPNDPDFVPDVTSIIAETGIAPDRVVLELVETALTELTGNAQAAMAVLTERGVRFAIDDFGTGYSSLARLKDLPAETLKLDRRFVTSVDTDNVDHAIARAVIDMAGVMDKTCIAEGVESRSQLRTLDGLGVDLYQGYLFSAPLSAEQLRERLTGPDPF